MTTENETVFEIVDRVFKKYDNNILAPRIAPTVKRPSALAKVRQPILHRAGIRACQRRMPDAGEKLIRLPARVRSDSQSSNKITVSFIHRDEVCTCNISPSPMFTSRVQTFDLQMYDKVLR